MSKPTAVPPSHMLRFPQLDREISCREDETIFQSARRHGLRIVGACGGRGACGACTIHILRGRIGQRDTDAPFAGGGDDARDARKWTRACCIRPRSDCTIEVAERSLAPIVRADVQTDDVSGDMHADPVVAAHDITVPEATLHDNISDFERVQRVLGGSLEAIDIFAARELPEVLRNNAWSARVYRRASTIVAVAPPGRRSLGLAVDLGTTNVAGFLIELETGKRLASLGIENPQVAWGADLVSRITYAIGGRDRVKELQHAACTAINALCHDLCHAIGSRTTDVVDLAICGNTAMQHLLLGLPVRQLGRAPFIAALRDATDVRARELGLDVGSGASVYMAANIGGFVGSDHVAALQATRDLWMSATASLVMDIGTNTEISLIRHGEILSVSCPSGPALEGGHISCGMRAADGAIERVRPDDERFAITTIGDRPAVGICGSGILDAVAASFHLGILDKGGRIVGHHPAVGQVGGRRAILLAPDVHVTQSDVRAVQLAKAAIRTGVDLLLDQMDIEEPAIERFVLAGAFGSFVDVPSAREIGLFPDIPIDRFLQVGNAAGCGITRMLASGAERSAARDLAARCTYVELSTRPAFQKCFMRNIGFEAARERRRT
ncbi:MAG: ASKHA domain-containing protein [Beijerinckiaceae bacterium]